MYYNLMQSGSQFIITTNFPDILVNDDLYYAKDKPDIRQ
jgi:hypothetical protein